MKTATCLTVVPSRFPSSRNSRNSDVGIRGSSGVAIRPSKHAKRVGNEPLTPQAVVVLFTGPTRYGDVDPVGGGLFAGQDRGEMIREMSLLWSQRIEGGRLPRCA